MTCSAATSATSTGRSAYRFSWRLTSEFGSTADAFSSARVSPIDTCAAGPHDKPPGKRIDVDSSNRSSELRRGELLFRQEGA